VVGDVNYRQVKSSIEQYFGAWQGVTHTPAPRFSAPTLPSENRAAFYVSDIATPRVSIGAISATENDDSKAIRRDALLCVLGNRILEQRINQRFIAEGISDANVELSQQEIFDTAIWSKVESHSSNTSWLKLSGILTEEINKMVEHGVTRKEFQQHAYALHAELEKMAKNKALQSTEYKADLIVQSVNQSKVYLHPARIKSGFELHMSYLTEKHVNTAFSKAWQQPKALFVQSHEFSDSDNQAALELIQ
jgi:predicted Zn-dependent peptidase